MKKNFFGGFITLGIIGILGFLFTDPYTHASIVVNTNVASLKAKQSLEKSQASLHKSFERLSSGLRINKASDDAAGLGISESKDADFRAIKKALTDVNDSIVLIQTAEGAAEEVGNILKRMRELALQTSSETLEDDKYEALNTEFDQLKDDADRMTLREPRIDINKETTAFQSKQALKSAARFLVRLQDMNDDIQAIDIENSDPEENSIVQQIDNSSTLLQKAFNEVAKTADVLSRSNENIIKNAERKIKKLEQQRRIVKPKPKAK